MAAEELLEFINMNKIRWLDVQYLDVDGRLRSESYAANKLLPENFVKGFQSESISSVFGYYDGTPYLLPDIDTYAKLPWENASMRVLSHVNLRSGENTNKHPLDSRYILQRALTNAKAMGIRDITIGQEVEYYLFDSASTDKVNSDRGPNFVLDSRESISNPSPLRDGSNQAHIAEPFDAFYTARVQTCEVMEDSFNYQIYRTSHGRSSTSQQLIEISSSTAKVAADALVSLKFAVRNISSVGGFIPTFMPLPVSSEKGSRLVPKIRLWKGNQNIFSTPEGYSDTLLYFIGGILEHAEALTLFTNPTTNSYKRLKVDPVYVGWGNSPNLLARVSGSGPDLALNLYSPDPTVNPYLLYAALISAGLDGIRKKSKPFDEIKENINTMSSKERRTLKLSKLPSNLLESIASFESDNSFLKGIIPSDYLAAYLEHKIKEHRELERTTTAYELKTYFNY